MTEPTPRIAPVSPPYTPEMAHMLEKWMPPGSGLAPLAIFRTLARHELLSERMRPLGAGLLGRGELPIRVRELLILRTCARCGAEYEWGVHVTAFAAAASLDEALVARTRLAPAAELANSETDDDLVMRFADELHDHGHVENSTWHGASRRFDDASLLEMLAVVGFYHLISFVVNGAQVAYEPWAARFPSQPAETASSR